MIFFQIILSTRLFVVIMAWYQSLSVATSPSRKMLLFPARVLTVLKFGRGGVLICTSRTNRIRFSCGNTYVSRQNFTAVNQTVAIVKWNVRCDKVNNSSFIRLLDLFKAVYQTEHRDARQRKGTSRQTFYQFVSFPLE